MEKRFIRTHMQKDGINHRTEIWVDRETGINYLYHAYGYGGGLTVLLDKDGNPVISPLPVR